MKPDNELTHEDWEKLWKERDGKAGLAALCLLDDDVDRAKEHAREYARLTAELERVDRILNEKLN